MPVDKLGQEIVVGSYIVYGHALGRCAGLRLGKVLVITPKEYPAWQGESKLKHHFTVIGVDDDHAHLADLPQFRAHPEWYATKLLSKKSTIQFAERIIVLSGDMLPENIKKLLDEYEG